MIWDSYNYPLFLYFKGVSIDGNDLKQGTDYSAVSGSTVVTVEAGTLEKLDSGKHELKLSFNEGEVSTTINIEEHPVSPDTSDNSNLYLYVGILVMAIIGLLIAKRS